MLFFSNPGSKYTPFSNRLNSSDKLIITSSVTKDVYIRPCISLIRYHIQIPNASLKSSLLTSTLVVGNAVFRIKIPGFGHPYNLFESKIRVLIQITLCRNARIQMDLSKNKYNRFSAEEAINYIPRTQKRKKVPVCEMFGSSRFLSSLLLPILSWKLKNNRNSSTIHPSSKVEQEYNILGWSCFVNTK